MKKYMKEELERRYNEIFQKLYINYMINLDNEYKKIVTSGLSNSGAAANRMYYVVEKLVYETIDKLDNLINEIKITFKPISLKDLNKYIEKSENTINAHIDNMQNIILEKLKDDKLLNMETIQQRLNNIKENSNYKLKQIYLKNKNISNFKKIEWLVIINTVATIGGFILTIISFFIK